MTATVPGGPPATTAVDPAALLRSPQYVRLLVLAALLGAPVSAASYAFLELVGHLQPWVFSDLPDALGLGRDPLWWPLLPLAVAGLIVGLTIRFLPGGGGESPADGFHAAGPPAVAALPGIFLAATAGLALGAVIGPEAPLIALGGGVSAWALRLVRHDAPAQAVAVIGAAGSFAAVSTLFGSPLLGAFLLMEVAGGVGGAAVSLVLLPGLLAAGIGTLVFVGLDSLTGLGAVTLSLPGLPQFARPDVAQFLWAFAIGAAAAVLATAIRRLALALRPLATRHVVEGTVVAGVVVACASIAYAAMTDKSTGDVLFSGQTALPRLISESADYSVPALLALLVCKGLAYSVSLSSFRGGPVFPAMFLGAAGGILLSHAPGLPLVPAVAMGIGAMSVAMLRLPLTSVMLATLLLFSDGLAVMPLVIVAVVVAHVATARLQRMPGAGAGLTHGE
jgi:H+/Cl- antiporter ClcA